MTKSNRNAAEGGHKQQLLAHYSEREPTHFIQYDVFVDGWDSYVTPDEDGQCVFMGETYELMTGGPGIRVLLADKATQYTAVVALRKIADMIEKKGIYQYGSYPLCGCENPEDAEFVELGAYIFQICGRHDLYRLYQSSDFTYSVTVVTRGEGLLEAFRGRKPATPADGEYLLLAIRESGNKRPEVRPVINGDIPW